MEALFLVIATLCYLIGSVGYVIYLYRDVPAIHRVSWAVLLIGACLHGAAIVLRYATLGELPATTGQEALSLFAWILVITYLIVQVRLRLRILGSFVVPLAVIFMVASSLLPSAIAPKSQFLKSGWVVLHVSALLLANALFALASSVGIMYLLQERQIKKKHFGFLYPRLPSLERLDSIGHYCLMAGFPLMTTGLVTGFAYASIVWHTPWSWDPKEIVSLLTWLIYAVIVHERLAVGWRGRRAAWLAIIGFSAVLATFFGVNLLLHSHHSMLAR